MATSVRRPFIGSPQRTVVPSVCNGTELAALSIRNARGKIVYSWDAASLSVGSSDRIEGCIGPAIRLSYACAVAD
jgi:hypothetical protein